MMWRRCDSTSSCVDCDICCWMDPRTFKRAGLGAVVASQPKSKVGRYTRVWRARATSNNVVWSCGTSPGSAVASRDTLENSMYGCGCGRKAANNNELVARRTLICGWSFAV